MMMVARRRLVLMLAVLVSGALSLSPAGEIKVATRAQALQLLTVSLLVPALPAQALDREFSNANALFPNDFYFKFGTSPAPLKSAADLPGTPPFVRVQVRYDAYAKYSPKINIGLEAFKGLKPTPEAVAASNPTVLLSLRPMGLFANSVFATESLPNEALLARYYVNTAYFALIDLEDTLRNKGADAAKAKIDTARASINSYLIIVNRVIPPEKVGTPFVLIA